MSTPKPASRHHGIALRSRHLMELAVHAGDRLFLPAESLLRQTHPTHPQYTGCVVAQTPLEYAIALLESGGDAARANRIIRRTADFQDRDPASPTYGNFLWMTHWERVMDRNAVSFMTPNYAYLWRRHRPKLDARTRACLESLFPLALRGVLAHRVPPAYTNIFLLNILSKLELAAILADEATAHEARSDWTAWAADVSQHGIGEYNSPCYTAVDLYALEGIREAAPTAPFRREVEVLLEYVWTEFAANFHAGIKCLTGPMSRAYPSDYLYGNGLSGVIAFQQFGTRYASFDSNGGLTPFVVNFAMRRYVLPERIRAIALHKSLPVTVRGFVPQHDLAWVNYLTRDFSLGSQAGRYGGQEMPVFLAFRTRRKRRSLFFKSDPALAVLASAQDAGLLLGGFHYAQDSAWSKLEKEVRDAAAIRLYLGPTRYLHQKLFLKRLPGRNGTCPASSLLVAVQLGTVFVGIQAFLAGPADGKNEVNIERQGKETVLVWQLGGPPSGADNDALPVAAFFLVVAEVAAHANLKDFARHVAGYTVSATPRPGETALAVTGQGVTLSVQVPPTKQRQAPGFLHDSPYLQLCPGDLGKRAISARQADGQHPRVAGVR